MEYGDLIDAEYFPTFHFILKMKKASVIDNVKQLLNRMRSLTIILTTCTFFAVGQVAKPTADCKKTFDTLTQRELYTLVDIPPNLTRGLPELYSELVKIKQPHSSETDRISILISFIVESNGEINGLSTNTNDTDFANELLECLRNFEWTPGRCNGTKVPTKLILTLTS